MERKCKNCSTHDDFSGACFCPESQHRADFTSGEFVCQCHTWDSDTIKQAFGIVREAILTDDEIRSGFIASILSAVNEYAINGVNKEFLSRQILRRIIGEEWVMPKLNKCKFCGG